MIIINENHDVVVKVSDHQSFLFKKYNRIIYLEAASLTNSDTYLMAKYKTEEKVVSVMNKVIDMLNDEADIIDFAKFSKDGLDT